VTPWQLRCSSTRIRSILMRAVLELFGRVAMLW
jgi:hypothetical protein